MLPIAWYLLKVILCSGILYVYYWFLLRNKIFHVYNRFYLLATVVLSLLLPLIQISWWQHNETSHSQVIKVLQVVASGSEYMDEVVIRSGKQHWAIEQFYPVLYLLISFILLSVFIRTLYLIFTLLKKYPSEKIEGISFVNTEHRSTPFSFLKYIFWNVSIDVSTMPGRQIFKHEVAHIQERHTYDKLLINIILIFCWCNPFFWLVRKELNMIHEFIADKKAVEDSDSSAFAAMILQATYPRHNFNLANNFFYSPIKRRLLMLTKNKNPQVNYIGRILVLPLAVLIVTAFTLKTKTFKKDNGTTYSGKKITVVIDPACGGNNLGWHSATGINEKDINLAIAQKIKKLNNNDNIEIILTRNSDVDALGECRNIVDKNKANLFMTISLAQNVNDNKERGWDICIPYEANTHYQQSKMLGSILFNNFSAGYEVPPYQDKLLQRAWVMTFAQCPSVMVQPGHITNLADFNYFSTPTSQDKIAENILKGIEQYLLLDHAAALVPNQYDTIPSKLQPNTESAPTSNNFVKDNIDKDNALYIFNGKIIGTGNEAAKKVNNMNINNAAGKVYVTWLSKADAIKKYGSQAKSGACEITTATHGDMPKVTADKVFTSDNNKDITLTGNVKVGGDLSKALIYVDGKIVSEDIFKAMDPALIKSVNIVNTDELATKNAEVQGKTYVIYVSLKHNDVIEETSEKVHLNNFAGTLITPDILLKSRSLICDNVNYRIKDAQLYFSGKGFDNVVMVQLVSGDLNPAKPYLDKCMPGSAITFDNVRIISEDSHIKKAEGFGLLVTSINNKTNDNLLFTKTEISPSFPGGDEAWKNYLIKNIHPTLPVDEGWKAGTYTVIVQFIVHQDGKVSDVTTTNYPGSKTAQHCIDIIKNGPNWVPATQNGKKVSAYRKQPITFLIEEQ
jgi:N-acetylmuramoyl-L-alanine amidase